MLSEYIFYRLGKRKARKEQVAFIDSLREEEEESEVVYVESKEQDSRSFEELLQKAKEHRAKQNN